MATKTPSKEQPVIQPLLVSREDAAKILDIDVRTLDRLREQKKIKAVKQGRRVQYSVEYLKNYVNKLLGIKTPQGA